MIEKMLYLIKMVGYKIRFGNKLSFTGIPKCERNSRIIVKSGKMSVGKGFHVRSGSYIAVVQGGSVSIGDNVFINRNCSIVCQNSVTIGECCAFGPNVIMYDHDHRFGMEGIKKGYKTAPVVIENNCWIGAGVVILKGTHIGEGCVIGAGAVVKGEIPAHSIVVSEGSRKLTFIPIK